MKSELPFRCFTLHPKVVLLEWSTPPDAALLQQLIGFQKAILKEVDEVVQITQGYCSLMLYHKSEVHYIENYANRLYALFESLTAPIRTKQKIWEIPVCYEEELAPDLKSLAKQLKMSTAKLIRTHTSVSYQVYFIGFLPGFLYLSGLPSVLECDRKAKPIPKIERGSVAIGGKQTGIYPLDSPGGWHRIGKTPYPLFDPKKKKPCFAQAGDTIQFKSISKSDYFALETQRANGTLEILPL